MYGYKNVNNSVAADHLKLTVDARSVSRFSASHYIVLYYVPAWFNARTTLVPKVSLLTISLELFSVNVNCLFNRFYP
jgi:hypothetical protein